MTNHQFANKNVILYSASYLKFKDNDIEKSEEFLTGILGLQETTFDQLVTFQNTRSTDEAASPLLQTFTIGPNVMAIIPDQNIPVSNPLTMQLLSCDVANQDFQQPSTSQQINVSDYLVNVQENVEESHENSLDDADDAMDNENQSPNMTIKRPLAVEVKKSTKKHASSDMKFRCFEINWGKLSDNVVKKLNCLQEYRVNNPNTSTPCGMRMTKSDTTSLINNIVDQLRVIDTEIKANTMESVAKQLLNKYPCLELVDDDGYKNGMSHVVIKHKMINRNTYLNRFRSTSEQTPPPNKGRNVRAGTLKGYWKTSKKECDKNVLSMLRRDDPKLLTDEFLGASQAFVRYLLSETKDLKQLILDYPVLRRKDVLNFHFMQATGTCIKEIGKYYGMKREKIINYSNTTGRKFAKLNIDCSALDVFGFLAHLVGENIFDLIVNKEIGTRLDEIYLESPGPLLVAVDMGQNAAIYYCRISFFVLH